MKRFTNIFIPLALIFSSNINIVYAVGNDTAYLLSQTESGRKTLAGIQEAERKQEEAYADAIRITQKKMVLVNAWDEYRFNLENAVMGKISATQEDVGKVAIVETNMSKAGKILSVECKTSAIELCDKTIKVIKSAKLPAQPRYPELSKKLQHVTFTTLVVGGSNGTSVYPATAVTRVCAGKITEKSAEYCLGK